MHPASDLLTDPEINRLSVFLDSIDTSMNIERLDGFLCALISGPDIVMPSEYWPIVLGCDPTEAEVFSTDEEAEEIIGLVAKHWNSIATRLYATEIYTPAFLEDDAGEFTGVEWANGFLEGVNVRKESWSELFEDEDDRGLIMPMVLLALANDPDPETRSQLPPPEQHTEIIGMLGPALLGIYDYFKQRRTPPVAATPVRRAQPKVGRNEPCPCGSGEKYKNCCLRSAH